MFSCTLLLGLSLKVITKGRQMCNFKLLTCSSVCILNSKKRRLYLCLQYCLCRLAQDSRDAHSSNFHFNRPFSLYIALNHKRRLKHVHIRFHPHSHSRHKKFWEELIAYFPLIITRTAQIRKILGARIDVGGGADISAAR
jgi:hypothetical protein